MLDILKNDKGPFQVLFGDDASADPNIVFPIVIVVFVVLIIIAFRIILNDKGKSEMTEEELEEDRKRFDSRMQKSAEFEGKEYRPELARAAETAEIAEANRRYGKYGKKPDKPDKSA